MTKKRSTGDSNESGTKDIPASASSEEASDNWNLIKQFMGAGDDTKAVFKKIGAFIRHQVDKPASDVATIRRILAFSYASLCRLPDYATLNYDHSIDLDNVSSTINDYLNKPTLSRPLNFLILASPGAGKSQLVKSIAKRLDDRRVEFVRFNMATKESKGDLEYALGAARNIIVEGKMPIVFLDEFDANDANYALLLPVLWDGELEAGGRMSKLVRSVFFLAGSRPGLAGALEKARNMGESSANGESGKLRDLFSRINGTAITIPSLHEHDQIPDKVAVAMALLRRRFLSCQYVAWRLIAFVAKSHFRYDCRSIAALIDLLAMRIDVPIESVNEITVEHLKVLPLSKVDELKQSPLAFHLIHTKAERGIVEEWQDLAGCTIMQPLRHTRLEKESNTPNAMGLIEFEVAGPR